MKVHLVQMQVLLLQRRGNAGKFIREKSAQVAFFAADQDSNVIGMNHGAHFHVAEGRGAHPDPHFRLGSLVDDLSHLYRASGGMGWKLGGRGQIQGRVRAGRTAAVRLAGGAGG